MFRIGEFSKIAQVSGRQLRFYEQIGLLKPEFSDPQTGYRFYTAAQLPRLNRILALKDLGFTLEEISPLLDGEVSQTELRGMLALKRSQVSQVVYEETARLKRIESRIEQIDTSSMATAEPVLKSIPAQPYLAVRTVLADMAASFALLGCMLQEVPQTIHPRHLASPAVLMHFDTFEWEEMDVEMGFLLSSPVAMTVTLSDGHTLTVRELSALPQAATLIRVGPIETAHGSYQAVGRWIEAQHLRICGPSREVILQVPSPGNEMVTEIQLPVEAMA
jgi:DNA-binding transcriptional MerR regulator